MLVRKTPTSSLSGNHASNYSAHNLTAATATELFIKRIWYRSKARIWRTLTGGASPGNRTTPLCHAMRLPQEIVEMIMVHLIHNLRALRSCSLTCCSWYMAATPHLYPTFNMNYNWSYCQWSYYILSMHALGLLPLVHTVWIQGNYTLGFSPKWFKGNTLSQFLTLTNIETLDISGLNIPSFIPRIKQYFGPFSPTLRSLSLWRQIGSNGHIIFFIGLFQHLENLSLSCAELYRRKPEDPTLIPLFTPPLRGRLIVWDWREMDIFRDMIRLFGGIRFSAMSLTTTDETRVLLRACAKTLRVLRLSLIDPPGKRFHITHFLSSQHPDSPVRL